MPEQRSLAELQAEHYKAVEQNRAAGVVEWKNGEQQSDRVYEVQEGYMHLTGAGRLGQGHRFRPTVKMVETNALENKARELSASEYASIQRDERRPMAPGADIGIRALEFTSDSTMEYALQCGLTEADFDGLKPGYGGKYTRAQVDEILIAKQAASN